MKPNIDLKNPIIQKALGEYQKRITNALSAEQTVEKAIIPIYHISNKGTKLEQIASGVLVNIDCEYFIFSASHVFDQIGDYALCTGCGEGDPIVQLPGERFSSPRGKSGNHSDDIIDASCYHVQAEIPVALKSRAITLEDFNTSNSNNSNHIFLSAGFRIKKSNSTKHYVHSKNEAFASFEVGNDDYTALNLDSEINIALWHEEQVLIDGLWQLSPRPRGFSGGAIIKVIPIVSDERIIYKQKLAGIITEHRKKTKTIEGVIIGTRVNVHLSAIKKFMPDLTFNI